MKEEEEYQSYLNKLVVCDQDIGVIRYIGPIKDLPDIWFGIEWRDSSRGKHDGTFKGTNYFKTSHPNGGSFVKLNKIDFGVDIWKAAKEKYLNEPDEQDDLFLYNNFKVKDLNINLNSINLAHCKINRIDTFKTLKENFVHMTELDLEYNLLSTWNDIFNLLNGLDCIKTLNVSNNILNFPDKFDNEKINYKLNYLILNRMNYDWDDVLKVVEYFPNLSQLKVCFNQIKKIEKLNQNMINNLKVLDLESNPINEWKNLLKLGELKQFEELLANNIGIKTVYFDDCEFNCKTKYFPKLNTLALNENEINDWYSINELNKLISLTDLRIRNNPLNRSTKQADFRAIIIAKIGNLKILNRTGLNNFKGEDERQGDEFDYLKSHAIEWSDVKDLKDNDEKKVKFLRQHPRYQELVKIYGAIDKSEIRQEPDTLKNKLINIHLKNELTGETITKKLPSTLDIQRLKLIVSKLFKSSGFEPDSIKLSYTSQKNSGNVFELDNDMRNLSFYSIENDDIISIFNI